MTITNTNVVYFSHIGRPSWLEPEELDKSEFAWIAAPIQGNAADALHRAALSQEGGWRAWDSLEEESRARSHCIGQVLNWGQADVPGLGRCLVIACSTRKGSVYPVAEGLAEKFGEKLYVRTRVVDPHWSRDTDEYVGG